MPSAYTRLCQLSAGIWQLSLNRPEKHNALHPAMIQELVDHLHTLADNAAVRVLILCGEGPSFSSGADLNYMQAMVNFSHQENVDDARKLATLMQTLNHFPKPVICAVKGNAFAGAIGLIACSDIIVASNDARFCISETRLGIAPAVISPYLIARMGNHNARRFFLSAEVFDALSAQSVGLVHTLVEADQLQAETLKIASSLLNNAPGALTAAKTLIHHVSQIVDDKLTTYTCELIAGLRAGEEGQQGLKAFLEKKKAPWLDGGDQP
ncbi:MAG: enoyl-CoA hydratase-related protein [Pseudomonadales bacterium]|nr:enoyl-CoA hydratase-related protein [Pseudomonadales bacterium]